MSQETQPKKYNPWYDRFPKKGLTSLGDISPKTYGASAIANCGVLNMHDSHTKETSLDQTMNIGDGLALSALDKEYQKPEKYISAGMDETLGRIDSPWRKKMVFLSLEVNRALSLD